MCQFDVLQKSRNYFVSWEELPPALSAGVTHVYAAKQSVWFLTLWPLVFQQTRFNNKRQNQV